MKIVTITALALCLAAVSTAAHAANTGNELLQSSINFAYERPVTSDLFNQGTCAGIIQGTTETLGAFGKVCTPQGSTHGQTAQVVVTYMRRHPETNQLLLSEITGRSLMQAWPCKK
jgi:Rap1a immunity proteins